MDDLRNIQLPERIPEIEIATREAGFNRASDPRTGCLLRFLSATKPSGRILELGTGTGLGTCWILDGMDADSRLDTVDNDPDVIEIARRHLTQDPRVSFHLKDGADFLRQAHDKRYDLIFADAWPGKFWDLEEALDLLRDGGIYVIDDMLPQPNWDQDHPAKADRLIRVFEDRKDLHMTKLNWSTGIILATKCGRGRGTKR